MTEFRMDLPPGFVDMLRRKHDGCLHSPQEILAKWRDMKQLYDEWKKYKKKLDSLLDVEWEEKEVEKHYGEPIFYNAHRKLTKYRNKKREMHKRMFFILTSFDGNHGIPFVKMDVMSPEEIYYEFCAKYIPEKLEGEDEG